MKVSIKYYETLEESLKEDLAWLEEEFEILFNSKMQRFTENDKKIANEILDYILENMYVSDNIILLNLLTEVMESIEKKYVNLF